MIKIEGLTKYYGTHCALDDINLEIPSQAIWGLVGPNGAGKTTLLKILLQILSYNAGHITYEDKKADDYLKKQIGYLPEQRGLYMSINIKAQLEYFCSIRGMDTKASYESINKWLKIFDIQNWADKRVAELSKGMQQKIQFMSCLVSNPKYVFMDEPFSGIDPINFRYFVDVIKEYNRNTGATIIMSTHNMKSIEQLCTDVAFIRSSKILVAGDVTKIIDNYSIQNSYKVVLSSEKELTENDISDLLRNSYMISNMKMAGDKMEFIVKSNNPQSTSSAIKELAYLLSIYNIYSISVNHQSMEDIFVDINTMKYE